MKTKIVGFLAAIALIVGATLGLRAGDADPRAHEDPVIVASGKQVYADNCASCHGANLEGQENWQSRNSDGRLPAPPHDASGHTWHHPTEQLFQLTKYGPAKLIGGGYESDMIGYEDILSDDEIRAVLAYIKSTWPDEIIERHTEMDARG